MTQSPTLHWAGEPCALAFARLLIDPPGSVVELRALGVRRANFSTTVSGYFNDPENLVATAASLDGQAEGIYVTLNPVLPQLLARASNRLVHGAKQTTGDKEIVARRFLPIDLDPVRPAGISSTEEEKAASRAAADEVEAHLRSLGFPPPIKGDSGNGSHLLYRVDLPADDDGLVKRALEALAFKFDTDKVSVDRGNHNPARIWKLYGTLARKGDSTPDRPHRRSCLLELPEPKPVPIEILQALAARVPGTADKRERRENGGPFDVETYLKKHGIRVTKTSQWQGGRRWILERCPFNPEHVDGAAYVVQLQGGGIGAGCHHNSCEGKGWVHLRDAVDPGWREREPTRDGHEKNAKSRARQRRRAAPYVPFPTTALPEPLRSFVGESSRAIGCDPAFVALPLLAETASAIGNTRRVRLKRGWYEPSIIWAAILGESGSLKSPAVEAAMKVVWDLQTKALQEYEEAVKDYERQKLEYDKEVAQWKKEKGGDPPPKKPEEPIAHRYYCADTTVEALATILRENWRGVLLIRDELSGWLRGFNQYKQGKGADTAHWLEMHGGRPMLIDRKTGAKKIIHVPMASVSITGGIQPPTLKRCLEREHFEDGLAARLLLAFPPRKVKQWTDVEISVELQAALGLALQRLYALEPGRDAENKATPVLVDLTPGAKLAWISFYNEHAVEQADLTGDLSAAWSKLEAYAARFALIIHLVRQANDEPGVGDLVDEASVGAAVELTRWFAQEAKRIYGILSESEEDEELRQRAETIERKGGRITVREWQRARGLESSEDAEQELVELVEEGRGRWDQVPPGPKGGRPTRAFVLARRASDKTPSPDDETATDEVADGVVSMSVSSDVVETRSEVLSVSSVLSEGSQARGDAQPALGRSEARAPHDPAGSPSGSASNDAAPNTADTTDIDTTHLAGRPDVVSSPDEGVLSEAAADDWGEV